MGTIQVVKAGRRKILALEPFRVVVTGWFESDQGSGLCRGCDGKRRVFNSVVSVLIPALCACSDFRLRHALWDLTG